MSGIEIRSGGAVEVDSDSLRAAAARLRAVADDAGEQMRALRAASDRTTVADGAAALSLAWAAGAVGQAGERADDLAGRLEHAAGRYETAELLAAAELARAAGDAEALAAIDRRLHALWEAQPRAVWEMLATAGFPAPPGSLEWQVGATAGTFGAWGVNAAAAMLLAARVVLNRTGFGAVPAGARLAPASGAVGVARTAVTPVTAPRTLAEVAARIPGGGDARVRVERYPAAGRATTYAVYIAGTQSGGPREAFDMRSNLQLYGGERSASYRAVEQALRDAGAAPGDRVAVWGHSQGAMIGEHLALEGGYDVPVIGSFGSPVQAELPEGTLAVSVRHTDDPVAALQGGGHAAQVGAPGSFVVERVADPAPGWHDATLPAHHMSAYAETAALVDASADPRVDGLRDVLAGLGGAGEAIEYSAERLAPRAGVKLSPRGDADAG